MKKFLSLFLAVLMLASMAVSTSAIRVIKSESGSSSSSTVGMFPSAPEADELDLLDYFTFYNQSYGGAFHYKGETYYTWMYDNCPECNGLSFQFVKEGKVFFECLEKKCGKSGTIKVEVNTDKEEDKYDDLFSGKTCPDCGGKKTIFIETVSNGLTYLRDRYFCLDCRDDYYTYIDSDCCGDVVAGVHCSSCYRYAYFDTYTVDNGILFARYLCKNGHSTYKKITSDIVDYDKYRVYVYCSTGGDYEIDGVRAYYGEKKTIEFYPDRGYFLADVLVDGVSVPITDNEVEITVKNNTVVRAYFERVTSLKTFTIETESEGSGTITAKKNGKAVSAGKVTADYTDNVTYTFVPASKNYRVAGVWVNGKSVGKVSSYTVSKIKTNIDIEVEFEWANPYSDVKESYAEAVEYVTEAGIMSKGATSGKKILFNGGAKISVRSFIDSVAEMADVADVLDNTADRIEWAIDNDLIDKDTDISAICDVQTGCYIIRAYLEALEDINDIRFDDLKYSDSVKDTCVKIDMVTEKIYDANRDLTRYDLAAICYLVAGLDYAD